ncbi:MAG: hypothetical protein LBL94_08965 [Prevotellaceae bacterium]|jgi:hypothetical protein|nr:hypothetical protein [Prevotellaceae bacterium]
MKHPKKVTPIMDGINRRFFVAVEALVAMGHVHSLEALCKEFGSHPPRYREMRLTYGVTPNPNSKPSRYVNIEMDAIYHLCTKYPVSVEWLMLGRGKMYKNEAHGKI